MKKAIFVLFTALILVISPIRAAHAQEGSAVTDGWFPMPPEHYVVGLSRDGDNLIDETLTSLIDCEDYSCSWKPLTVCVAESADQCHAAWIDTRAPGHDGNTLFVNGVPELNPRMMSVPLVRYGADLKAGERYKTTVRSRNICGWCMTYPELSAGISVNLFSDDGSFKRRLVNFTTESDWVEYSVEFTADKTGRVWITAHNTTAMWAGNDLALDMKLVHIHDRNCRHDKDKERERDHRKDDHEHERNAPPRPGSRRH